MTIFTRPGFLKSISIDQQWNRNQTDRISSGKVYSCGSCPLSISCSPKLSLVFL